MISEEMLSFIYSIYPKIPWDVPNGHEYKNTIEQKKYKLIRALHLNNYGKKIEKLMSGKEYILINENRSHDFCFKYDILCNRVESILDNDRKLIESLGGMRTDVYLYISKLTNIFTMECEETYLKKIDSREQWTFKKTIFSGNAKEIFDTIYFFLVSRGMKFADIPELERVVPDIETEYTSKGETTVFNLLFTPLCTSFTEKTICL